MRTQTNRQITLKARPAGRVTADLFELAEAPRPSPGPGEMLIRVLYLSVDPAMRGWIAEAANYSAPVPLGGVMRSFTLGEVVESNHPVMRRAIWSMGGRAGRNGRSATGRISTARSIRERGR